MLCFLYGYYLVLVAFFCSVIYFLSSFLNSYAEAVPKKILDLMNVEGLTRENVASHLQVHIFLLSYLHNV